MTITNQSTFLTNGTVGLIPQAGPGRITGVPTTTGTFGFVVRATDTKGAFAERNFSITVNPA